MLQLERQVLREFSRKVGCNALVFDKIYAWAVPESNTVRAGDTYRATLFLSTTGSDVYGIRLEANGQPIKADYRQQWPVQFPIPAAAAAGGASWEGAVRGRYHGRDTTFRVRVPYTIRPK